MEWGEEEGRREERMRNWQSTGWTRCSTDARTRQARPEAEQVRAEDDSPAKHTFSVQTGCVPGRRRRTKQKKEERKRERASEVAGAPMMSVLVLRYEITRQKLIYIFLKFCTFFI